MKLFTKIYSGVLILFVVIVSFVILQIAIHNIAEHKKLILDKHLLTGKVFSSEIERWYAEGKWPFEMLNKLNKQDDFIFWWIIDNNNRIYLADSVDYIGTNANEYFTEIQGDLDSLPEDGGIALSKSESYGVFSQLLTVGNEKWLFWHGFSTLALRDMKSRIIFESVLYSLIGMVFLGVFLFIIIRRFLSPLNDLSLGVKRIGLGNLDYRIAVKSLDEIGLVARAFNWMAVSLQEDISERKRVQEELDNSFKRFQTVLDSVDAIIYVADMKSYELLFINRYGQEIFGHDITGKVCWQALQTEQVGPCPFCTNAKLIDADGAPTETYVWQFQNTITGQWFECRDQAIPWTDNRLVRMEIATDITQNKLSEIALAEEKERLAVTLRSIGDGVITTDTSGAVVLLSKVAEELTGWSNEEAAGRSLEEVFHIINERTGEVCENPVTKIINSGQVIALGNQTSLIARDGTKRSIADSGAPILDAESNIVGVVLVFRDVSEQIRTEKELLKVKKLESVGVLAGGIAHDFNNILTAILGSINLALYDTDMKDDTKRLLAVAEKASLRAKDLTQQLLTFAKGGEPVKEISSLEIVIKDSANFVLHGDKVACRYNIPEDLWLVDIDKGQMSQVIQNIVLNASHAMPDGGAISVSCENLSSIDRRGVPLIKEGKFVKISIQDTGIGIASNIVERIFDPYFSTKQHGSGLGLAISQSIINKHYGNISVESSPGTGTTFTIYLPASENSSIRKRELSAEDKASSRAMILLMDDEEMVRAVCQKMLVQLGHDVVLAADGEEAIQLYKKALDSEKQIDLLIMDLTIPGGMGGEEAVQEILKLDPNAKVIVASGYSNDPIMANYKAFGFCSAITKPFMVQDLVTVIGQNLDQ